MKGSLDKGKAFRTEQAKEQLRDMLLLALSEGQPIDAILKNPAEVIRKLGLARNPDNLVKDGWNEPFSIRANQARTSFVISSERLKKYNTASTRKSAESTTNDDSEEE